MTEDQRKHLEMVQAVIARLAGNSFAIKGWSVTLASALLVLSLKDFDVRLALLSLLPVALFWLQDAYFLRQERLFRNLYEAVRRAAVGGQPGGPPLFSMNTAPHTTDATASARVAFSSSLLAFHGALAALILLGIVFAGWRGARSASNTHSGSAPPAPALGKTP